MTDYKEIATPSRTKEILKSMDFHLKEFRSKFLTEPNILRKIVETAELISRQMLSKSGLELVH